MKDDAAAPIAMLDRDPQAERLFRAVREARRGPELGAILRRECVIDSREAA